MNKVVLIGRLVKDLELQFTPGSGTAVAKGTIAVERRFSKDGEKKADFIPIVIWGKQAESSANYTGKGKLIGISGRIETRNYDNKEGKKVYVTEVVVEEIQFLEWGSSGNNNTSNEFGSGEGFGAEITPVDDGDIPF